MMPATTTTKSAAHSNSLVAKKDNVIGTTGKPLDLTVFGLNSETSIVWQALGSFDNSWLIQIVGGDRLRSVSVSPRDPGEPYAV